MENTGTPLGPYRTAKKLKGCELEKEALEKQVEELKAQLQTAVERQEENLKLLQEKSSRQQEEVRELNELLEQERAINLRVHNMREQLSKDLDKHKEQLARQKSLKEMFVNKEKETRNELERLKRLMDTETTDTLSIATEVGNNIKKRKKKVLQKDFEELKVAYIISQEKFSAELHVEKDKNRALQQTLEHLKGLYQMNLRYETELEAEREKSDSLQKQLEEEIQSQAERLSEKLEVIKQLRAEKEALLQQMEEEIQTLKKNASEKDKSLTEEVNQGLRSELSKLKEEEVESGEQEKETPSVIYRMLSCCRRSKAERKSLRRKRRNTQSVKTSDTVFEEEEGGEAGGNHPRLTHIQNL